MNEMHDLQERNRKLQQQLAEYGEGSPADVEKEREKLRRLAELIKFQLNPDKFPKVKFGDDVKVPSAPCSCSSRRSTRNMYCKVHRPVNTPGVSDNKGKCVQLVEYLSKELKEERPYYDNFFHRKRTM